MAANRLARKGAGSDYDSSESREDGSNDLDIPCSKQLPSSIVVTRAVFDSHLRGVALSSWEELLARLPAQDEDQDGLGFVPEGAAESIVKIDPLHMLAWAATFCIQLSLWGCVYVASATSLPLGIACTVTYGIVLWCIITRHISPQLAGMLWPNLPCAVAVCGGLLAACFKGGFEVFFALSVSEKATWILLLSILPQTGAAAFWMAELPRDPDRAVLVANVFLGVWAAAQCIFAILTEGSASLDFSFGSLLLCGLALVATALRLFIVPSRWGSPDLISWTMNVGCLSVLVALGYLLQGSSLHWAIYAGVVITMGVLGREMNRTGPMLLSVLGLVNIVTRASGQVGELTGNSFAAFFAAGVFGICIILFAHHCCHRRSRSQFPLLLPFVAAGDPSVQAAL